MLLLLLKLRAKCWCLGFKFRVDNCHACSAYPLAQADETRVLWLVGEKKDFLLTTLVVQLIGG